MTSFAADQSLCPSCTFVRRVEGRLGQVYLLCGSPRVPHKYPPQPVRRCEAYAPTTR